jgi:molybdenum cofactor biosynthesis enzyme MoaA
MRIQTFSIVAGTAACNARCGWCVAEMTPPNGVQMKEPEVNWRNFRKACLFAKSNGVTTVIITGKGEPALFPHQITEFLTRMLDCGAEFPFVELQTNGIPLVQNKKARAALGDWYSLGLSTVIISVVHFDQERNRLHYVPYQERYIDLPGLIDDLHGRGFTVRLSVTMQRGDVDCAAAVREMIDWARDHGVDQLSLRPVTTPEHSRNLQVLDFARMKQLSREQLDDVRGFFIANATPLMKLMHGAQVFDVDGQNVCLTNCLTIEGGEEDIRQLIFFPDGKLMFDWQYAGARIL